MVNIAMSKYIVESELIIPIFLTANLSIGENIMIIKQITDVTIEITSRIPSSANIREKIFSILKGKNSFINFYLLFFIRIDKILSRSNCQVLGLSGLRK